MILEEDHSEYISVMTPLKLEDDHDNKFLPPQSAHSDEEVKYFQYFIFIDLETMPDAVK